MNTMIISTSLRKTIYVLLLAMLTLGFVGCEKKGPAERAGESIDEAAEDLGNKIEDACEDVKEGMGAKDDDC